MSKKNAQKNTSGVTNRKWEKISLNREKETRESDDAGKTRKRGKRMIMNPKIDDDKIPRKTLKYNNKMDKKVRNYRPTIWENVRKTKEIKLIKNNNKNEGDYNYPGS